MLGSASAQPSVTRHSSAQVVKVHGRLFLLDCSEGVQIRLREAHIAFTDIDIICVTHAHGDHSFGIFGLLSTMGMLGRTNDLHIYAPAEVKRIIDFYSTEFGSQDRYEIVFHLLDFDAPQVVFETKNVTLEALPLKHSITTYGFIIREKAGLLNIRKELIEPQALTLAEIGHLRQGEDVEREDGTILKSADFTYRKQEPRSYAYITDTAPFKNEAKWLAGVDYLYHEATYPMVKSENGKKYNHTTTHDAAILAKKLGVKRLYIGHFSAAFPNTTIFEKECREIFPDTFVVNDLETIEIL